MNKKRLVVLKSPNGKRPLGINVLTGLSKENEEDFLKICSIIHAGTSKHENGAIPKALFEIGDNRMSVENPYKLIAKDILGKTLYFIIRENHIEEYAKIIAKIAESNYSYEWHGLKDVIDGKIDDQDPKGWIDLNENIIFFIDKEMATQMDAWLHCD